MSTLEDQILAAVSRESYRPVKARALARQLGLPTAAQVKLKEAVRGLAAQGRIEIGKGQLIRKARPVSGIVGVFRRTSAGSGFVKASDISGAPQPEIYIAAKDTLDAATGDEVIVKLKGKANQIQGRGPRGVIVRIVLRETRQFVGTYFERDGQAYVRVDGGPFRHSVLVGDADTRRAQPGDKVVVEMLHFPTLDERGEGVISEVLGPHGAPGVDTLSILRQFEIPDRFPEDALQEARETAAAFDETHLGKREDLTALLAVTIDPADAKDFDDAISLERDARSHHWILSVHIADVAHFVPAGGPLDREARKRGTSVYLPGRVVPMLPELISNGLASLQQQRVRFVKTVRIDFTPTGQPAHVGFSEAAIRVRQRLRYEEVGAFLEAPEESGHIDAQVRSLLLRMRDLALILHKRRVKRGSLELSMQEAEIDLDENGAVVGAHFRTQDLSHQIVEEFMLAANEAVAEHLTSLGVPFLRRIHPAPEPNKLEAFAEFAREFGYKIDRFVDRYTLQKILKQAATKPEVHAVNYALLRSLKQAVYSPVEEEHYALASKNYCHFTSPIRRYPDLTVHRLLHQWVRTGRAGCDPAELAVVGAHSSKTERRAEKAERELIKLKLLTYMSTRIGLEMDAVITGVADYGFFAQAVEMPVEGLVHVSTLDDDYYYFDEAGISLRGRRGKSVYRLGDRLRVRVIRVDLQRRQMDFRVVPNKPAGRKG
jgi:ribonuclease R